MDDNQIERCDSCGAHFQVDSKGDIQDGECPECGGTMDNPFAGRKLRDQPSPTKSDGAVRDMVNMDTGKDEGGNPLGEGILATIMSDWQPEGWDAPDPYSPEGDRCPQCKNHRLIDVGGSLLCPECKWTGEKFVEPGGTERMTPAYGEKGGEVAGNPLSEGTIMGDDGEKPWYKRDNYMHGSVLAALMDPGVHPAPCPQCGGTLEIHSDGGTYCDNCGARAPHWENEDRHPVNIHEHPETWRGSPAFGKVAVDLPMGFQDMYHVSPRKNRESILEHGLQGHEEGRQEHSPWDYDWPQPPGNYLFDNLEDARGYAHVLHSNQEDTSHPDDWENRMEDRMEDADQPADFHEWPEEKQEEWYDDEENYPKERTEDPKGYDIWKVHAHGLPIGPDPEAQITQQGMGHQWDLGLIHDEQERLRGEQEGQGYSADSPNDELRGFHGSEPKRYTIPTGVHPSRLSLEEHRPTWNMTEESWEDAMNDAHGGEYPQPWAQIPLTERPMPGHEAAILAVLVQPDENGGFTYHDQHGQLPSKHMLWTPGMQGRGILINNEPHTWNMNPNAQSVTDDTHSAYVAKHGIDPNTVDWRSGIEINPNGEFETRSGMDHSPYIATDPRLQPIESIFSTPRSSMDNFESRVNNMDPYESLWEHSADVEFSKGPDANIPQHSVTVTPGSGGLHSSPSHFLNFLDAHVNGIPVRGNQGDLIMKYGIRSSPEFGKPLVISVHHPSHLAPAAEQVQWQGAGPSPLMNDLGRKVAQGEAVPPPGVNAEDIGLGRAAAFLAPLAEGAMAMGGGEAAAGGGAAALGGADAGGAAGGLMSKVMGGGAFQAGKQMLPGGGGGGPPQAAPQPEVNPLSPMNTFGSILAALVESDYETPASNPDVGVKHDDPEDVDQKEFNDQDKSPKNIKNPEVGEAGGATHGEDQVNEDSGKGENNAHGFGDSSAALERMGLLMPLLLHYYHSEESGADDPLIKGLHEMLEAENPGYLDKGDPQITDQFIQQHKKPDHVHAAEKTAIVPPIPGITGEMGGMQQQAPQTPAQQPPGGGMQQGHCPSCGGVLTADGTCPQCGAKANAAGGVTPGSMIPGQGSTPPNGQNAPNAWGMPNAYSSVIAALVQGANHQGPVTPEQIAAVQQWLIAKGRVQEVPNVALDPGNPEYVKILSEIQNQPEVAAPITPEEQTPPPPPPGPPGGAPGAMPVPGMGGEPGGQPMQPMSSFLPDIFADDRSLENKVMDLSKGGHQHCPQCMGELGMLHDGQYHCADCGYMGRHTQEGDQERIPALEGRTAADNVAPRCPKCDSATTGMVGDADNHARCHACKHMWKIEGINDMASGDSSITSRTAAPHPSQQANPMGVPAAEQDAPLNQGGNEDSSLTWEDTEGQAIRANQEYIMKNPEIPIPDIVRVLQVKPDSLHVELLGTVPGETNELSTDTHITKEETEMRHLTFEPLAQNADDRNNEPPPGEAQTPGYQNNPPSGQTTDEHQNSYPPSPVSSVTAQNENVCPHCGHKDFYSSMSSPVTVMHDCYRCGKSWETKEEMTGSDGDPGRFSWVMEDDDEEDWGVMQRRMGMRADAGTRSIGDIAAKDERLQMVREKLSHAKQERTERLAGKNFTPSEQRDLIDEDGIARNSDLLDLAGTHYEARDDWSGKHNAENVPDEHFAIGLLSDLT